ncbi:hypothetical protein HZA99_01965 [Candidatus Woesearchaeota archaeon]|nr:hypothetical protein [Candidatus Woesearchaeota archaeon]
MKSIFFLTLILLLIALPFAAADSLSSLLAHYNNAKKDFEKSKTDLSDCQKVDADCSDLDYETLDNAVSYAKASINLMLSYISYADDTAATATAQASLEKARDNLQYVKSKEDFKAIISSIKTSWTSVGDTVKQKPVEDLKDEVDALVEKGKLIDAKLDCGIGELSSKNSDLDASYKEFAAQITEAEKQIKEADSSFSHKAHAATVLESVQSAQESLKNSQASLTTALDALTAAGGSLCSEVTVTTKTTAETNKTNTTDKTTETTKTTTQKSLSSLLEEYSLSEYYNNADDAISSLKDYIHKKQNDGYDTSKAEDVLAKAEQYMTDGENLVKNSAGKGAFSKFLNAEQTAGLGLNVDYYKLSASASAVNADYNAFVSCMEKAGYATQRQNCYDEYGISSGTADDIESCLDSASTSSDEADCYLDAKDEAQVQISSTETDLQTRMTAVDDDMNTLEDDITALYNALSASGESTSSSDYRTIDHEIDALLSDARSQHDDYDQTIADINKLIDDGKLDTADRDLTDLEDEVSNYIDDTQNQIDDIQNEIDSL